MFRTRLYQELVGVFAPFAVADHPATFVSQAAEQLLFQFFPFRVGIAGYVDHPLIFEMAVHKTVHPLQVTVGTSGHRYHVSAPCRDKGGCIQLSFGDDTFRVPLDAVDVVGISSAPVSILKCLWSVARNLMFTSRPSSR